MIQNLEINYNLCIPISGFQIQYTGAIENITSQLPESWHIHNGNQIIIGYSETMETIYGKNILMDIIISNNFNIIKVILSSIIENEVTNIPAFIVNNCIYTLQNNHICDGFQQFSNQYYEHSILKGIHFSNMRDMKINILENDWIEVMENLKITQDIKDIPTNSYQLQKGINVVQYPETSQSCSIEKVILPKFRKFISSIIGEKEIAIPIQNIWSGNLMLFKPGKSYYFTISDIEEHDFLNFYFETSSLYTLIPSLNKSSSIHTVLVENDNILVWLSYVKEINASIVLSNISEANIGIFSPYNNYMVGKNNVSIVENGIINKTEITIMGKDEHFFLHDNACTPEQIIENLVWVLFVKLKNSTQEFKYTLQSKELKKLFNNKMEKVTFKDRVSYII